MDLVNALQVQEAIDAVFAPLGRSSAMEEHLRNSYRTDGGFGIDGDEDEDSDGDDSDDTGAAPTEGELTLKLQKTLSALHTSACKVTVWFRANTRWHRAPVITSQRLVDEAAFRHCYDATPLAAYGDAATQTTRVDENVRRGRARDAPSSDNDNGVAEAATFLAAQWEKHFGQAVRVEPYRCNLYAEDDFFAEHRDTPTRGMLGTGVVATYVGSCDGATKHLCVRRDDDDARYFSLEAPGDWCLFYGDCPHSVLKSNVCRATMTFRVFGRGLALPPPNERENAVVTEVADFLGNQLLVEYPAAGFLLSHSYALHHERALKGTDALLAKALARLGDAGRWPEAVRDVPVRIDVVAGDCRNGNPAVSVGVHSLEEEHLRAAARSRGSPDKKPRRSRIDRPTYEFFLFDRLRESPEQGQCLPGAYRFRHSYVPFCEYTGNECQPENVDSVYIHRALCVRAKDPEAEDMSPDK